MKVHRHNGRIRRDAGRVVRGDGAQCCCTTTICSNCITLFQATPSSSGLRKKSFFRGVPDSQYVFKDFTTTAATWGAYVAPTPDGFGFVEGTGNPPYSEDYSTYFNAQTCSKLYISPFITGAMDEQTGDFTPEYTLKTTSSGVKAYPGFACFGQELRPFAASYNTQTGTLLNTFPYWLGPLITNEDCPALADTGSATITPETTPGGAGAADDCCRVGGYETGSAGPLPTWEWLQTRDWWNYDPNTETPLTFADGRLVLVVSYLSLSMWRNYGGMPEVHTWMEMQAASDSGARVMGAFISREP